MTAHRATRRRPVLRVVMIVLAAVIGLVTAGAVVAAAYVGQLASSYDRETTVIPKAIPSGPGRPAPDESGAMNVLLLGSDSRADTDEADAGSVRGRRSDVLMVVHIPADRESVQVMSIMRDSWVDIPGHGSAKINAAYAWGGVPLVVQTVENLLDTRIDHVAEIGFAGFAGMTDALGGVEVDSPLAFSARGFDFTAGQNHLDGKAALAFVRERYAFPDADHQRVRNQQAFLRGLVDAVLQRGTLSDPGRLNDFIQATVKHLSIDEGLTPARLASIGWGLRSVSSEDITFFTMKASGGGVSADGQWYLRIDGAELDRVRAAFRADDVAPLAE